MAKDLVWNEDAAELVRSECEQTMRSQAENMRDTVMMYVQTANNLDDMAREEERIALTAMMSSTWTDAKGISHWTEVPDTAKRAEASAKASAYRQQSEALRRTARMLREAIQKLEDGIDSSNKKFYDLQERIQAADMAYARMFARIRDDILRYNQRMLDIYNSFDDNLLTTMVGSGLIPLKWGPVSKLLGQLSAKLAGKNPSCTFGGDPVNLATGNFIYSKTDIEVKGRFPLVFKRFYNSSGGQDGVLGPGWAHSFDIRL